MPATTGRWAMDGRRYLEKLIADRLDRARRDPHAPIDRSEIRGVALGLVAASALGQKEMEEILAELDRSLEALGRFRTVPARLAGRDPLDAGAPAEPGEAGHLAPRLLRVVPLVRDLTVCGTPATLVSLEVWSTSTRLHLAYPSPGLPAHELLLRWRPWHAHDDAGVRYRGSGGGSHDSGGFLVETRIFEPGPAEWARTFTVCASDTEGREEEFSVPLR